jgi:hypothetical protein
VSPAPPDRNKRRCGARRTENVSAAPCGRVCRDQSVGRSPRDRRNRNCRACRGHSGEPPSQRLFVVAARAALFGSPQMP